MRQIIKETRITTSDETIKQYFKDVNKIPLLSEEDEYMYAMRVKDGDEFAIQMLIKSNLRFVITVAKQSVDGTCNLGDLINEGNLGLIYAVRKFDPAMGFKFISYAVWWIRQKINEHKNEHSRPIRLPANKIALLTKVRNTITKLEHGLDRDPTVFEISDSLSLNVDDISNIMECEMGSVVALDNPDEEHSVIDLVPIKWESTDYVLMCDDKRYLLERILSTLKPRELKIIQLYYGLNCDDSMTLDEIGSIMGLTREAIRLIRDKSINKLKVRVTEANMDFMDIFN